MLEERVVVMRVCPPCPAGEAEKENKHKKVLREGGEKFECGTPRLPCRRHRHRNSSPPVPSTRNCLLGQKGGTTRDAHEWVTGMREKKVSSMGITHAGTSQEPEVPLNRAIPSDGR